jgi:hypothetical protein
MRVLRVAYNASVDPPRVVTRFTSTAGSEARHENPLRRKGGCALPSSGRLEGRRVRGSEAGIVLDFNAKKQVVGIEVLDLKRRGPKADPRRSPKKT